MRVSKILCAYDGSKQAADAFDWALDMAAKFDAELLVLGVVHLPEPPELVETSTALDSAREFFTQEFALLRERSARSGARVRLEMAVGHPAEQIVHRAEAEEMDLIVMGHRGRSRTADWLLGSVSKRVLSYAPCAVLIVR